MPEKLKKRFHTFYECGDAESLIHKWEHGNESLRSKLLLRIMRKENLHAHQFSCEETRKVLK